MEAVLIGIIVLMLVALLCAVMAFRRLRGSEPAAQPATLADFDEEKLWRVRQAYGHKHAEEILVQRFRRQITGGDGDE